VRSRIFKSLTILSTLAFLVVLALWVRGFWYGNLLGRTHVGASGELLVSQYVYVYVSSGLGFQGIRMDGTDPITAAARRKTKGLEAKEGQIEYECSSLQGSLMRTSRPTPLRRQVFPEYSAKHGGSTQETWDSLAVYCPWSILALVTGVLPGMWLKWTWRQRRRRGQGLCQNCGYDLRASTERCPECGTPIPLPVPEPHPRPSA
jgi:hypothetical protein